MERRRESIIIIIIIFTVPNKIQVFPRIWDEERKNHAMAGMHSRWKEIPSKNPTYK
jgi:hypothetical protein